jgi:hypothetical protein
MIPCKASINSGDREIPLVIKPELTIIHILTIKFLEFWQKMVLFSFRVILKLYTDYSTNRINIPVFLMVKHFDLYEIRIEFLHETSVLERV